MHTNECIAICKGYVFISLGDFMSSLHEKITINAILIALILQSKHSRLIGWSRMHTLLVYNTIRMAAFLPAKL